MRRKKMGPTPTQIKKTALPLDKEEIAQRFTIGDPVKIDTAAERDSRFTVTEILEFSSPVGGTMHSMVDLILVNMSSVDPEGRVRLRFLPSEDAKSSVTDRTVVLKLFDNLSYDEGLHNVVRDDTMTLMIHDDTDSSNFVDDLFWRINDVSDSHVRSVKILSKTGLRHSDIEYWDYSRLTDLEGVETEEFIFVELNPVDGAFQIWRGVEVAPEKISVG